MTVALIDIAHQYGGAETRVVQLLRTLPGTFALCLHGSGLHRRCTQEGLAVHTVRHARWDARLITAIAGVVRARGVAAVDAHGVAAQLWGLAGARLAGVPRRVVTVHSEYGAEQGAGSLRGVAYETVLRTTRLTATDWIAVSPGVRDDLTRLGLPAQRITIVRSGVDAARTPLPPGRRAAARRDLGYHPDHLVTAVVGRLHDGKGHRVLLEAFAAVAERLPQLRLLLVGDGPERTNLQRLTDRLGLTDRVAFTGFRTDIAHLLALADGFCLPTDRSEGLPYALLEAAAAGLPAIATRLGAVPAVFTDGENALLVAPGDRAALARALLELRDPALRGRLGTAARTMARRQLSVAAMTAATARIHTAAQPPVRLVTRARRAGRASAAALAASAPADHTIALLDRVARRSPNALPVLMYHRVAPVDGDHGFDPVLLSATPESFADQIDQLSRTSHLLTLAEVIAIRRRGRPLPPRAVLLTFDDAYRGFLRWAWPVLQAHDAPCVVFAPTAYPGDPTRQFWWEDLYRALQSTALTELGTPLGVLPLHDAAQRTAACHRLSDWVKATDHAEAVKHLDSWLDELGRAAPVRTTMSWDELRMLAAAGVEVAPHSRTHAMLDRVAPPRLADEIHGAIDDLRTQLGTCPPAFCFPAGQRSPAVRDELRRAGVEVAFSTVHGVNRTASIDWLDLQRIDVSAAMPTGLVRLALHPWAEPYAARFA
ncbi:hypothetical protein BH23ACT10_BH23ACT10_36600 [soil metagenome]